MYGYLRAVILVLGLLLIGSSSAIAREWSCPAGKFKIEGDLVAFDDKLVVVKQADGSLSALEIDSLCEEDREYIKGKDVADAQKKSASEMQTWTSVDGMKIRGQVIGYGQKDVVVQRKYGKVHIDDKEYSELGELQQKVVLRVLSQLEKTKLNDQEALEEWAKKTLKGTPKPYPLSGVVMRLENGEELRVPFFLFSKDDLEVLKPGWELWLEKKESDDTRKREDFLMRTAAMQYQKDRAFKRKIELIKLDLLGATAGVVDIWRVQLVPKQGVRARPMTVLVTAHDSSAAQGIAMTKYPGFVVGGVARTSR